MANHNHIITLALEWLIYFILDCDLFRCNVTDSCNWNYRLMFNANYLATAVFQLTVALKLQRFEDTKGVINTLNLKDKQYNCQR
jgi:hypothetical protein